MPCQPTPPFSCGTTPVPTRPLLHSLSQLIIDDAPLNLTLSTVLLNGTLSMGSPTCRLSSAIAITFVPSPGVATGAMAMRVGAALYRSLCLADPRTPHSRLAVQCFITLCMQEHKACTLLCAHLCPPVKDRTCQGLPHAHRWTLPRGPRSTPSLQLYTCILELTRYIPVPVRHAASDAPCPTPRTRAPQALAPTGKLDVHGALYTPTWTRLSATAYPGQRWVQVQAAVNWRAGQLVAVPTSLWKDECRNQVGGERRGFGIGAKNDIFMRTMFLRRAPGCIVYRTALYMFLLPACRTRSA